MYIRDFRVSNYKSFVDSGVVDLGLGFNIICGQNNSGKTALLESLDFNTSANPHRSLVTVPTERTQPSQNSQLAISIAFTRTQFLELLREVGPNTYYVSWPNGWDWSDSQIPRVRDLFLNQEEFLFKLQRNYGPSES